MTEHDEVSSKRARSLSISQERLWVLEQLHPGGTAQTIGQGLRRIGLLDQNKVQEAVGQILHRHEILRAEFRAVHGVPEQVLLASAEVTADTIDLQHLPEPERESQLSRLALDEIQKPFDLGHGPVLRATLFQLSAAEHVILLTAHRIVCDERSLKLLLGELDSVIESVNGNASRLLRETPLQYRDFAAQEAPPSETQISYWQEQLAGTPANLDLPTDRPRPAVQRFGSATHTLPVDGFVLERLRALGQAHGITLFSTLLTAFNVLLYRYSRQEDLVVGTRVSGRGRPELENLIGPLENLLALRSDISGEPTFLELLARVHKVTQESFSHAEVPFETLVKRLHVERDLGRHPIFQILFDVDDSETLSCLPDALKWFDVDGATRHFDLAVKLTVTANKLEATISYNPDLFDASTIERMGGHFRNLLEEAAADPTIPVSRMSLLSAAERQRLLVEWNDTEVSYALDQPLHKFIEAQVEKTPGAVAVVFESERITYRQLNDRANQLAYRLKKYGVGPDVLVAVCAERSLELVIALLSILKAGGAYVPFDPEYPKDRLETMLESSMPPVVLTQAHLLDRLPGGVPSVFCLDRDWPSLQTEATENLPAEVTRKSLAYAIYTSGSTGKPKGVPNVHEGIVNRLLWMQEMYKLTDKDRVLQKTPFSFDVSVWEFFWPLMTGATLVMARPGGHRDPAYLVGIIADQGITTLHFVPSMLSIFLETAGLERCRSLRQVFASGEALSFELQQRFFDRLGAELHNLYGPTEAAVDVTYWTCHPDSEQAIVPIGRPIANTQIYILDKNLEPVPIGVGGELHIGGIGLARGYLNRPDLTAEKFIPDPFSEIPGARLYKTGDLARFLADGNIEYLGRIDFQVKLRGFRIELGEIEAVLGECAGVLQAVVIVREDNPGDKRLVAYLLSSPGHKFSAETLRSAIQDKLPEYMVPSRFIFLETFPLTTSGKVDRKALPAPPQDPRNASKIVPARTELEAKLASLFASTLNLPSVGVTDNFFDLGGHSLLAGRLLARVQEATGRQIPLSALFRGATVESLAHLVEHDLAIELDPLIMEIQHGASDRIPFFAIVPPGEESLGYAMLARHMGSDQTVYKVQAHAPITGGKRPYTEQEMQALAEEYIDGIRSVQPHGPYCLGGFCDGTHIAEKIVLGFEKQGEEIGLFAIFDTWVLQHSQRRWLWKVHYYGERLRELKDQNFVEKLASYKRLAENKVQHLKGNLPARTDWQQAYWPKDFTAPRFRAPVVLFKRPKQPFYYIHDREMGWGTRTESGVEIHEVDLNHLEILREPHVRTFGEKLSACMARIGRRATARPSSIGNPEPSLARFSGQQDRHGS